MSSHTASQSGAPDASVTLEDGIEGVRGAMDAALADEDWDRLQELDGIARALVERAFGVEPAPQRDDDGTSLRAALQSLARFYEQHLPELQARQADVSRQLRDLRSGRRGISAYETTRRHTMRANPGKPSD
ncbi:flagellar protein FliT [Thioalkalivibrio sp. AKL19]|uniref:flagellar protein FliT n=1 Tax=Thioalkalivibrio sp. AKL19 TaxID=1266914 RepID=UPI000411A0AE|nr:flagellar protein FliT [Thioalkalivibrio sp. AKL19]